MTERLSQPGVYLIEPPPDPRHRRAWALVPMHDLGRLYLADLPEAVRRLHVDPRGRGLVFHGYGRIWRFRAAAWRESGGECRPPWGRPTERHEQLAAPPCEKVGRLVQRTDGELFYHCSDPREDWIFRSLDGETWSIPGGDLPSDEEAGGRVEPSAVVALDGSGHALLPLPDRASGHVKRFLVVGPGSRPALVDLPGRAIALRPAPHGFEVATTCESGCWAQLVIVSDQSEPFVVGEYADPGVPPYQYENEAAAIGPAGELYYLGVREPRTVIVHLPLDGRRGDERITDSSYDPTAWGGPVGFFTAPE